MERLLGWEEHRLPNYKFIREVGAFQFAYRTAVRQFYKRFLRREHQLRLPGGETLWLPVSSHFASEVFITQCDVDWGSEALLLSLLDGRGAFLDIGANIGYYSLLAASKCPAVYSFEPDPRALGGLRRNIDGNAKITLVPLAVGGACGMGSFTLESDCEVSHLSDGESRGSRIEVEITTVDAFTSLHGIHVEAIKIDAEGQDIAVLRGAMSTLTGQMPIVLTECSPDAELFELTRSAGYRVFAYLRQPETRERSFAELLAGVPIAGETKMLFLIPEQQTSRILANDKLLAGATRKGRMQGR
jgi:FkbM family methyltransferase